MILLSQGYMDNRGTRWDFPSINEHVSPACLRMLAATHLYVSEHNNEYTKFSLHVEYGNEQKESWNLTTTLNISFYVLTRSSTANVLSMLMEAVQRLYNGLPEELQDFRGVGTEVMSYMVKIIQEMCK